MSYSETYHICTLATSLTQDEVDNLVVELAKQLAHDAANEVETPNAEEGWEELVELWWGDSEEEAVDEFTTMLKELVHYTPGCGIVKLSANSEDNGFGYFGVVLLLKRLLKEMTSPYAHFCEHIYDTKEGPNGNNWFVGKDGKEITSTELANAHFS